jgi:1-acyl-sn-glycerol-3-phosphate acyltransferase
VVTTSSNSQATITYTPALNYTGADTFLGSVWRTLCARGLVVHVAFAPPDLPQGRQRRAWATDLRLQVMALRAAAS